MDVDNLFMILLFEEEEDEVEAINHCMLLSKRQSIDDLFKKRKEEGYFHSLINRYLKENETQFREFFRLNLQQFNYVLSLIGNDIKKFGSNCVQNPIKPEEKLALTLR
ncbi:hypothetical protein ABEB36_000142 [Hypothenemus hampei]|uniref:Uncharacterized protein n=1 Tax=Hypothenemus hampei TaxID=57062 RepID=A0ABD1FAD7_HYPHA